MIKGIGQSAREATKIFRTFEDGVPNLIPTGLPGVDRAMGGLFPGSAAILAASQGSGKSSTALAALFAVSDREPVGYISLEDTEDVVGSRAISVVSGINSLDLRRKVGLTDDVKASIEAAQAMLDKRPIHIAYAIGAGVERVTDHIRELGAIGCRMVYVDYIQKIRDQGGDRRNAISGAFSAMQAAAADSGCALVVISQFRRTGKQDGAIPQISWLKESGDLENEARLIILMYRDSHNIIRARIAKSTFGGEGTTFQMVRDESGTLREVNIPYKEPDEQPFNPF